MAREKLFNMRMSAEEWERLDFLAKHYGLNAAGVLRMLVKREADVILQGTRGDQGEEQAVENDRPREGNADRAT